MDPEETTLPGGVTPADHEAGFKDIQVLLRTGARVALRLYAPPALEALTLYRASLQGQDITNDLLNQAVKADDRSILNKMDVDSLLEVHSTVIALAWGQDKQKKILSAARELLREQDQRRSSTNGAPSGSRWLARGLALLKRLRGRGPG